MGIQVFRTDEQGTIIASTDGTSITWNVAPCNDYSAGDKNDKPAQPQKQSSQNKSSNEISSKTTVSTEYILNTSTKKIHYPDCKSVKQMSEKNKKSTAQSRDSLISQGYSPCGNCRP